MNTLPTAKIINNLDHSRTPIAVFAYRRRAHLETLFSSLEKNGSFRKHPLYVFVDGAKTQKDVAAQESVREFLEEKNKTRSFELIVSPQNKGLAQSIIQGVSQVLEKYDRIIVLEDDLALAPFCLDYFEDALNELKTEKHIGSVTGYNYPIPSYLLGFKSVYLSYRACSWGWATWKDRWEEVDWEVEDYSTFKTDLSQRAGFNKGGLDLANMMDDYKEGRNNSWAVRWAYYHYKNSKYCLYPTKALIQNTGNDGSGTHCEASDFFKNVLNQFKVKVPKQVAFERYYAELQALFINSQFRHLLPRSKKVLAKILF